MATTKTLQGFVATGDHRRAVADVALQLPDEGVGRQAPGVIGVLRETVLFNQFTDGGGAVGTYQLQGSVPAGAVLLGSKVTVEAGFAGNVSAALTIGDGSDVDRYMTGTPSVFATAAAGIETGVPSGTKLVTTANRPTLTVTASADFTAVSAGQLTASIYYLQTA
jgi:hypothetical protein